MRQAGIEGVPQPVAQEVETKYGQKDKQAREEGDENAIGIAQILLSPGQHVAPGHHGRLDS